MIMNYNVTEWKRLMKMLSKGMEIAKAEAETARKDTAAVKLEIAMLKGYKKDDWGDSDSAEEQLWNAGEGFRPDDEVPGNQRVNTSTEQPNLSKKSRHGPRFLDGGSTSIGDIKASSFHFFPSVSIIVFLGSPVRYLEWPSGTSLEQISTELQGKERNRDPLFSFNSIH